MDFRCIPELAVFGIPVLLAECPLDVFCNGKRGRGWRGCTENVDVRDISKSIACVQRRENSGHAQADVVVEEIDVAATGGIEENGHESVSFVMSTLRTEHQIWVPAYAMETELKKVA